MKTLFYKKTDNKNITLHVTETRKDAVTLYGKGNFTKIEIEIDLVKQYLFKNKEGEIVVEDYAVIEKPKLTDEEKEEKRQNFKINVISKKSKFISQRCLQILNKKRVKKEIVLREFKGSHKELGLILTLLTLGDIRGAWFHLKGLKSNKKFVPEDVITFLMNKTRRLLKHNYPRFLKKD